MAITVSLIIEDGSGVSGANSYASLDTFRTFWAQQNIDYSDNTVSGQSDNDISAALISATEYIDGMNFFGEKTDVSQALEFPRRNMLKDNSSYWEPTYLASGAIPNGVVSAVCYVAGLIIQGTDPSQPFQNVSSQSVSGIGSVTYKDGDGKMIFPKLDKMLKKYIDPSVPFVRIP